MSGLLFRADAYLRNAEARVLALTPEGGIVPEATVFYPAGGGQPGDRGVVRWDGGEALIVDTLKGTAAGTVVLVPADAGPCPEVGAPLQQTLDWARRYALMRTHTALHLLSVVLPFPVTGGQVGVGKGRLDFAMAAAPEDRDAVEAALNDLVARDLAVSEDWISDAELAANPGLVKTMSVKPPMGQGRVRLIRIGQGAGQVDLQPCGGTHVARTGEIGRLRLGKIENKGRQNRRVHLHLDAA